MIKSLCQFHVVRICHTMGQLYLHVTQGYISDSLEGPCAYVKLYHDVRLKMYLLIILLFLYKF